MLVTQQLVAKLFQPLYLSYWFLYIRLMRDGFILWGNKARIFTQATIRVIRMRTGPSCVVYSFHILSSTTTRQQSLIYIKCCYRQLVEIYNKEMNESRQSSVIAIEVSHFCLCTLSTLDVESESRKPVCKRLPIIDNLRKKRSNNRVIRDSV